MSHMLSMSCLCVYQSDGCVRTLWFVAIWSGLQMHRPLLPALPPRWTLVQSGLVWRKILLLRQTSPPCHNPISSNTHSRAKNKLEACPQRSSRALQSSRRHPDFCPDKYHSAAAEMNLSTADSGAESSAWCLQSSLVMVVEVLHRETSSRTGSATSQSKADHEPVM